MNNCLTPTFTGDVVQDVVVVAGETGLDTQLALGVVSVHLVQQGPTHGLAGFILA